MLAGSQLSKSFGSQTLFTNVSWRLQPGDRVGLVGPNGAGKTTLLRILVGQEQAEDGRIERGKQTRVGYLPQEVRVADDNTVLGRVLAARQDVLDLEREIAQVAQRMTHTHDAAEAL